MRSTSPDWSDVTSGRVVWPLRDFPGEAILLFIANTL
jgi:hypothetical protein